MIIPIRNIIFFPGWTFHASALSIMEEYLHGYHFHYRDLPQNNDPETLNAYANTLPSSAILIGWSLGGLLAIRLCAQYPERFTQLVLLGSSPKFVADAHWPGIDPRLADQFKDHATHDTNQCAQHFLQLTCYPNSSRNTREYFAAHRNDLQSADSKTFHLNDLLKADLRQLYASLKQPILTISGERDAVLPTKNSNVIIPNAGHAFFYTHTPETCAAILDFLGSNHAA
jgi:pimeloyl-[acyl-carrier protein] methyl ester esterase